MEDVRFLDRKGRLVIPAEFRKKVDGKVIITGWQKGHLRLYDKADWEELKKKWQDLPFTLAEVRKFQRFIFSQSMEVICDNQGRVLIPDYLRKHISVNLKEKVTVIVNNNYIYIEIWNLRNWRNEKEKEVKKY